jgi:hypothetical protein
MSNTRLSSLFSIISSEVEVASGRSGEASSGRRTSGGSSSGNTWKPGDGKAGMDDQKLEPESTERKKFRPSFLLFRSLKKNSKSEVEVQEKPTIPNQVSSLEPAVAVEAGQSTKICWWNQRVCWNA